MAENVHVITQDDWDEEVTMVDRPEAVFAPEALETPPKKLAQLNLFREVVEAPSPEHMREVKVPKHERNGKTIAAYSYWVKITPPKAAKKAASKKKKAGKYDHFDGDVATAKLVAKMKFQDTIDRVERIRAANKK